MRAAPVTQDDRFRLGLFLSLVVAAGLVAAGIVGVGSRRGSPPPAAAIELNDGDEIVEEPALWPPTFKVASVQLPLELPGEVKLPAGVQLSAAATKQRVSEEKTIYNGKTFRYVKTLRLRVTAYAPDPRCTWPYPGTTTASGLPVTTNGGRLVAADTRVIPMHSMVRVPGYAGGAAVPVLDRGGAIKGYRLDVLLPTYEKAKAWGSRVVTVKVYAPVK